MIRHKYDFSFAQDTIRQQMILCRNNSFKKPSSTSKLILFLSKRFIAQSNETILPVVPLSNTFL